MLVPAPRHPMGAGEMTLESAARTLPHRIDAQNDASDVLPAFTPMSWTFPADDHVREKRGYPSVVPH
jgi:hypothetical protein